MPRPQQEHHFMINARKPHRRAMILYHREKQYEGHAEVVPSNYVHH